MFTYPEWLHPSSRKCRWTVLIIFVLLLIIGIETVVNAFVARSKATPTSAWQCQHATETANPVQAENKCPGSTRWRADRSFGEQHAIEGFTAPVSIQAGKTIKIYVSTTASRYSFEVYRMGWYQGLGGRLLYISPIFQGIRQPAPLIDPTTRMVSCDNWHSPVALPIPQSWVSGVYLIKLLAGNFMRYISFVVRNDASHSAILFQTSVLTYQAYNTWGGYSLYGGPGASEGANALNRAYMVSFDRPTDRGFGAGDFPIYNEYNMLRWLERSGYDVSYSTDVDTDQRGTTLLQHRIFLPAGHDEYWSTAMRANVTTARDHGVSLAFFGANDVYWHVRLQSSPLGPDRVVVCYKVNYYGDGVVDPLAASHPSEATVLWRNAPLYQPENALLGEMYAGRVLTPAPLVLVSDAQQFFTNTTLQAGSAVDGLIGGEYDHVVYNKQSPSTLSILATSPLHCIRSRLCPADGIDTANATLYTATSGARVFDAGTFYWGWGLDNDSFVPSTHAPPQHYATAAFQRFTANILAYLLR